MRAWHDTYGLPVFVTHCSNNYGPHRPGHDRRYALDTRKLRQELGWQPEVSLKEGLRATVGWYVKKL